MNKLELVGKWLKKYAVCLENSCRDGEKCPIRDCQWVELLNILDGKEGRSPV